MSEPVSTWEQRMSERTKARQDAEREQEEAALAEQGDQLEEVVPLPGETPVTWDTPHFGHLTHWCSSRACTMCSCGVVAGTAAVVFPDPYVEPPPCEICPARKIGSYRE